MDELLEWFRTFDVASGWGAVITLLVAALGSFLGSIVSPMLTISRQARVDRQRFLQEKALDVHGMVLEDVHRWTQILQVWDFGLPERGDLDLWDATKSNRQALDRQVWLLASSEVYAAWREYQRTQAHVMREAEGKRGRRPEEPKTWFDLVKASHRASYRLTNVLREDLHPSSWARRRLRSTKGRIVFTRKRWVGHYRIYRGWRAVGSPRVLAHRQALRGIGAPRAADLRR